MFLPNRAVKIKKLVRHLPIRTKIQLLGEFELLTVIKKNELIDLTVENGKEYEGLKNKRVSIPCGALASGRNVIFYVAKGATPKLLHQV